MDEALRALRAVGAEGAWAHVGSLQILLRLENWKQGQPGDTLQASENSKRFENPNQRQPGGGNGRDRTNGGQVGTMAKE